MNEGSPSQKNSDFELLAQNDPRRPFSEAVGTCSVYVWRNIANLFDGTENRLLKPLPEEERLQNIGSNILRGVAIVALVTSIILVQDPIGL